MPAPVRSGAGNGEAGGAAIDPAVPAHRADLTGPLTPEQFRHLFDLAPTGIRVVDARGLTVFTNPQLAQMLGCTAEQLHNRPSLETVAPEDLVAATEAWGRRQSGMSETFPCRLLAADGSQVPSLLSAGPILNDQGNLAAVLEIITPLADLASGKGLGAESVGFAERALAGLRDGIWLTDAHGVVRYANPALGEMLAVPVSSLIGQREAMHLLPDPSQRLAAAYEEARSGQKPVCYEKLAVADRSGRSLLVSGWLIPLQREGRPDGMICTVSDVSLRSRDETVAAGKLAHLEGVLGHLAAPLIVWNAARRVTRINRAFERLTGFTTSDLVGRELGMLFAGSSRAESLARLGRLGVEEPVRLVELAVVRRDGQERTFQWNVTSIPNPENKLPLATVAFVLDVTERRLQEATTASDESGYRRWAEGMRVGLWVVRADGTMLSANPFTTELLGNDWDQLSKRSFHERVAPEHLSMIQQAWARWLTGVSESLECRFLRREGGSCDCLVSAAPLTDESGQVASVVLALTDISERKRREDALRESESALRIAGENLPGGFLLLELDGRIRAFNQPASQFSRVIHGRELQVGQSMYLVVAEKSLDHFNRGFQQARTGQVVEEEFAQLDIPGKERFFLVRQAPVGSVGGHAAGVLVTYHEVTQERQLENRRLEERESRRRRGAIALQQADSAAGIVEVFLGGARDLAGVAFGGLYLTNPENSDLVLVVANSLAPVLQDALSPLRTVMPGWRKAQAGTTFFGSLEEITGVALPASGPHTQVELGLIPIQRERAGEAWFLVGYPAPMRMDHARLALLESLAAEAGVALRRLEVEESLRQALEDRSTSGGVKEQIFNQLAHECRTPAAVAIGAAELLESHLDELPAERRSELLKLVVESSRRIVSVVDGLKQLGSPAATSTVSRVDLHDLLLRVSEVAKAADQGRHPIQVELGAGRVLASVDVPACETIVKVLLENALRFSPPGTPVSLAVTCATGQVLFTVDDLGIGIPEADRQRIFEAFERGSNAAEAAGVGLGLAVASRLAAAQGGKIECLSKAGPGSRFICRLPLEDG